MASASAFSVKRNCKTDYLEMLDRQIESAVVRPDRAYGAASFAENSRRTACVRIGPRRF